MNPATKRILIIFSVALNIGFIIMAVFHSFQDTVSKHDRHWEELMTVVRELELPESKQSQAKAAMARFRDQLTGINQQLDQAREDVMVFLTQNGPLDKRRLHQLLEVTHDLYGEKQMMFESHAIEIYRVLGDRDGARFFRSLVELKKSKHHGHG